MREGNAEYRLRPHGARVGLVSAEAAADTARRAAQIQGELSRLEAARLLPALRRPGATWAALAPLDAGRQPLPPEVVTEVEVEARYAGYIRQANAAWTLRGEVHDAWKIPESFSFSTVRGLSSEAVERLERTRPDTVGQARRIPGLTPAALSLVLVSLRRHGRA